MDLTWRTEKRKIKDLKLFDGNPRKMSDKQAEQLLESLKKFNYVELIAIDQNNRVIAGNMRVQALKKLGRDDEEIEVRVPSRPLTEEEAREYLLRSNKNTGEWDYDLLANFSEEELNRVGFESEELDKIFDLDLGEKEDEVPEPRKETNIKYGDIFQLGNHRVMCGDATKKEDVEKLMNGEKADMVFTDPPYGMNLDTDYSKMPGTATHYSKVIGDDKEFDMTEIFKNIKSPVWYVWGADYLYKTIPKFDEGVYIVWSKRMSDEENKVFGSAYELCWTYPKRKKEIWFVRGINQSSERLGVHPTQKPTELCIRALKQNADAKKIIDIFGGSGSTLIACEQLNRNCYMMELDPKYVDVIINRWEQFTGQKAVKLN